MGAMAPEQIAHAKRATERAKAVIKPGDRIARTMCGGAKGVFTFTHWEGDWMCGTTVSDCHAKHVYRVNGKPVDFQYDPHRFVNSADTLRWCGNCAHGHTACNSIDHYCYDCEDKPERPKFAPRRPAAEG